MLFPAGWLIYSVEEGKYPGAIVRVLHKKLQKPGSSQPFVPSPLLGNRHSQEETLCSPWRLFEKSDVARARFITGDQRFSTAAISFLRPAFWRTSRSTYIYSKCGCERTACCLIAVPILETQECCCVVISRVRKASDAIIMPSYLQASRCGNRYEDSRPAYLFKTTATI
jgi:hypothetical protein